MATPKKKFFDRLRKAFKDSDEAGLEAALANAPEELTDEEEDGPQRVEIVVSAAPAAEAAGAEPELEGRIAKIEEGLTGLTAAFDKFVADNAPPEKKPEDETPTTDEDADEEKPAKSEEVMDSIAKAEIILPGFKPAGTMDSAQGKTVTALRRDVLTRAFADSARRAHVEAVVGAAPDFAKMGAREMRVVFDAAAAVAKMANNAPRGRIADIPQGAMTAAKMQERIVERRKARG